MEIAVHDNCSRLPCAHFEWLTEQSCLPNQIWYREKTLEEKAYYWCIEEVMSKTSNIVYEVEENILLSQS